MPEHENDGHESDNSSFYLIPSQCQQSRPSGADSLVDLYGLRDFANSVARQDPVTNTKRKLRKSYKNHVSDLPGKHPIPGPGESKWTLLDAALRPPTSVSEAERSLEFSADMMSHLKFQKSTGSVPGFDPKLLAAPGVAQGNESKDPTARSPGGNVTVAPSPAAASPGGSGSEDIRKDKRKRKDVVNAEKRRRPNK